MAGIPIEIIAEILSRLPVKSLLRFQIVCKSWNSIVKSPNFIKIHLNQTLISNSDRHLLLSYSSLQFFELDLDFHHNHCSFSEVNHPLKPHEGIQLIGSCNGVVCISTFSLNEIFLYNPLTNSHRKLPYNQIPKLNFKKRVLGFGYDSKNDDYKVLRIVQGLGSLLDNIMNEAQVYSFNDNSWKCIEGIPYYYYYHRGCDGVLVNEALHHLVCRDQPKCSIARFDLQTESFSFFKCLNYDYMFYSALSLVELGGCLCLLTNSHPIDAIWPKWAIENVELWVMKEYGNKDSWVKLFCISQPEINGICKYARFLVYSRNGRRILLQINGLEYGWYDLESKNFERITAHGLLSEACKAMPFIGSLVSLENN